MTARFIIAIAISLVIMRGLGIPIFTGAVPLGVLLLCLGVNHRGLDCAKPAPGPDELPPEPPQNPFQPGAVAGPPSPPAFPMSLPLFSHRFHIRTLMIIVAVAGLALGFHVAIGGDYVRAFFGAFLFTIVFGPIALMLIAIYLPRTR